LAPISPNRPSPRGSGPGGASCTDAPRAAPIPGSVNIPLHELRRRMVEVPAGEIWVHCAAGYRASIAASFLAAAGRDLVAVDDAFGNARQAGLPVTGDEAA